ncbi:MAG: imelysin family protein, partial [Chitinophagaceae bacterium]|nr:imelysin family protein [Chitinophagaceae bacterium]
VSDSIQGLPALDYLLFSMDAVTKFSAPGAANRKKYVQDVITRIKDLTQTIITQWNNGYRNVFVSSLKTDVGSSIGLLVNQFALEMDAMKGPRIGWPFGKQSNGVVFADKCEGYYSGFSAPLAVQNLTSLKNYYTGGSGRGIDDYLVLLKEDQLNNDVLAQFDITINALKAIPDPLSAAFTNNATEVEEAYKQVQKLLTLLKTDVASATGVQINYMDNDGD